MKKLLLLTILCFSFLFHNPVSAKAQSDNFETDLVANYNFKSDGKINTELNISVRNLTTEKYLEFFKLSLNSENYQNIDVRQNRIPIPFKLEQESGLTSINITFPDKVVGKNQIREFSISFESGEYASKTGKTWDITLPKIVDETIFDHTSHKLIIPSSFGQLASVYPDPDNIYTDEQITQIEFSNKTGNVINATFGIYQVYSFDITYHLENPLKQTTQQSVAIIPDTQYQRVYYTSIEPKPENINTDGDGNWIASFNLEPREKFDVRTTGFVQLLSEAQNIHTPDQNFEKYLKADKYWETDNKQIIDLAKIYTTPEEIYNYTLNTLSYDYTRVTPTVHRYGAVEALKNPDRAICMEFTDTFIAISRAAGIPAREINGYAHTNNPKLQPLSLVADVLHSWPQYWDVDKNSWIEVDPTWESTTGGINYFDNRDLKHVTFVIHGESSETPYPPGSYKLGSMPQKDVYMAFSQLPEKRNATTTLSLVSNSTSVSSSIYRFKLENHGPAAVYDKQISVYFDEEKNRIFPVATLAPFASYEFEVVIPISFWGDNFPNNIKVVYDEQQIAIGTQKQNVILIKYFAIFIILLISILFILIRIKQKK